MNSWTLFYTHTACVIVNHHQQQQRLLSSGVSGYHVRFLTCTQSYPAFVLMWLLCTPYPHSYPLVYCVLCVQARKFTTTPHSVSVHSLNEPRQLQSASQVPIPFIRIWPIPTIGGYIKATRFALDELLPESNYGSHHRDTVRDKSDSFSYKNTD